MKRLTKVAVITIVLSPACFLPWFLPKPDPKIATPYDPPADYAQWWAVAESCAHKHKNLHHWKWYAVKYPHLDGQWWDRGLSTERSEVYVREGRTLDRTEVLTEMVYILTPKDPFNGDPDRDFFHKTLVCVGINYAPWRNPWRPNPP